MSSNGGVNIYAVKRILALLRAHGPISRSRLARLGSMGMRTLERYLDGLLVPLGMVEKRSVGGKSVYIATPSGVMFSVLLGALVSMLDQERHELKKELAARVEALLATRGLEVKNLIGTRCDPSTPADLYVASGEQRVLVYIAASGDEAVVKTVLGASLQVLGRRVTGIVVATPEKPCITPVLEQARDVYIAYYDPSRLEAAARVIADSVERLLIDGLAPLPRQETRRLRV